MVGCEFKNNCRKNMYDVERLNNVLKTLTIRRQFSTQLKHDKVLRGRGGGVLYDHSITRCFSLILDRKFIRAPKLMRKVAMGTV